MKKWTNTILLLVVLIVALYSTDALLKRFSPELPLKNSDVEYLLVYDEEMSKEKSLYGGRFEWVEELLAVMSDMDFERRKDLIDDFIPDERGVFVETWPYDEGYLYEIYYWKRVGLFQDTAPREMYVYKEGIIRLNKFDGKTHLYYELSDDDMDRLLSALEAFAEKSKTTRSAD